MRPILGLLLLALVSCSDDSGSSSVQPANSPESTPAIDVAAAAVVTESARFIEWLDLEFATELDFSPLRKTRLGYKSDYDDLDDVSEAALDERLQWRRDSVARMQQEFSRDALDEQGQLSWDLWQYQLELAELNAPFRRYDFVFGRYGPHTGLPNDLINNHRVDDLADMQAYISRLNQSSRYIEQFLERAIRAAADGIRGPYFDYQRTVSEIDRILSGAPFTTEGSSAIWTDVTEKITNLQVAELIDSQQALQLTQQARAALLNEFAPAYLLVQAWVLEDRPSVSAQAEGAWSLPNGEEYYNARLRTMTTLPLTADEIHQLGISEVARIQAEMEGIKSQVNFEGTLQEFFNFMREDEQFYFPNTDQGRQDYLNLADEMLATMYARLPDYFGILPKAGLQVKRVEAFREQAGGAAHYRNGTKDGSRPGTFYVHLTDMRAAAVNRLENLSYHEGVPGHHMQRSIQQEMDDIPLFRANGGYTAFTEGWGLYAEFLGKEMGGYIDPYADFGRLSGEIWRAVRLVVDTGMHAKRWTEEQAVQYALLNSPTPELAVRAEVQRYFNNPAQATSYKIGMLKIQEVRNKAEAELGSDFDIKAFHDRVLGSGPVPMSILETEIDSWTESVRNQ